MKKLLLLLFLATPLLAEEATTPQPPPTSGRTHLYQIAEKQILEKHRVDDHKKPAEAAN